MGTQKHHFVLVHGVGHGAWCWVKVVPGLEKSGHRVTTLDLASAGASTDVADDIASSEDYNRPLRDLLASFPDEEKVILVGHSQGGMCVTRMSELFPQKISVAVYLAGLMSGPGQDLLALRASDPEFWPPPEGRSFILHFKVEGGPPTSFEWPPERLKKHLYNKCSEEDLAFAAERLKRVPSCVMTAVLCTEANYGSVPRVYVLTKEDRCIGPTTQRKMIAMTPVSQVFEIDGDHSPFFSAPEDLVKILNEIAAKYDV